MVVHWDDVPWETVDHGELRWERQRLVGGLSRYRLEAGARLMPVHVHVDEEEHVVALHGAGLSWQDGRTYELRVGDVVTHRADAEAHTLIAGDEGLEVLIFASGSPTGLTRLPRARVLRIGGGWWPPEVEDPITAEPPLGDLPGEPAGRAMRIQDAEPGERSVLRHTVLAAGELSAPPHWHTASQERFVVLGGSGVAILGDDEHAIRAGSVVACEPGAGVPHALRAGDEELTYLAWGTREPSDLVVEPGSKTIRAAGVALRYEDGEA
jgi:uncharacterized cupin superfamily protein